jgi:hypothetical protein
LEGNSETSAFEQTANRRRCYAFAKGGNNTTGNKYILWPHRLSSGRETYTNAELGLLLQKDVAVQRILRRIITSVNVTKFSKKQNFSAAFFDRFQTEPAAVLARPLLVRRPSGLRMN